MVLFALDLLADWSVMLGRWHQPFFDSIYAPLRKAFGHGPAYFVADVLVSAVMWLLLEPLSWWIAQDVIRARWDNDKG